MSAASICHPDPVTIRRHVEIIHAAAADALDGARDPGVLQLSVLHPGGSTMQSSRFPIGAVEAMSTAAIRAAEGGLNVYCEGRTVEARASGRAKTGATRGVFAFVDDADHDKGKGGTLLLRPSLEVETSPGNRHAWLFLRRALTAAEADPIGRAMRAAVGSDSATAKLTQPYRIAGTPNFPDARKLARGRIVTPTRILSFGGPVYSAAELVEAFPPVAGETRREAPSGRTGQTSDTFEAFVAESGPDRSGRFFRAIIRAIEAGLLPGDVEDAMRRHPDGCGGKYLEGYDRLAEEIARAWPKAEDRLRRPTVDPTYPDIGTPVAEARSATLAAIEAHFADGAGYRAIRVGTGIGKTRAAAAAIAADVRRRREDRDRSATLYLVPTHRLGDEVAELFEAQGVTARVFRGRGAEDPETPGTGRQMCLDMEAVELAISLGEPVSASCCKGKHPKTGTVKLCPLFDECAYQRQVRHAPDVWIGAHDLLYSAHGGLGEVGDVVIDEGFWQSGLKLGGKGMTLDELGAPPPAGGNAFSNFTVADVAAYRGRLEKALRRQEGLGGLERLHLAAEGIDVALCVRANAAEWRLKGHVQLWPGMSKAARDKAAAAASTVTRIGAFSAVWHAARDLLEQADDDAVSGRLVLIEKDAEDGFGRARAVRTQGVRKVLERWLDVPVLMLDATLPDLTILERFFPGTKLIAEVEARTPHATVRQVLGAPVSRKKLLDSAAGRNRDAVRRAILLRFVEAGRKPTLVIGQKEFVDFLRTIDLPAGIAVAHYGAIAGLDGFKDVRLLIAIGRTMPNVVEVEAYAGALTGLQAERTAEPEKNGPRWYDKATRGLRLRDGTGHPVDADIHPDPVAEAVRWQVAEGGVIQAIGRARAVNRTASNPVAIEIWNDLALPVVVDDVMQWEAVPAGHEADMLADGVVLESPSDMADCWPLVWVSADAARRWVSRTTSGQPSIYKRYLYKGMPACASVEERPAAFRYQHAGERQKWRRGWFIPAVVLDPRAWLEDRLRTVLAQFELVSAADDDAADESPENLEAAA